MAISPALRVTEASVSVTMPQCAERSQTSPGTGPTRTMLGMRPLLVINPPTDADFVRLVATSVGGGGAAARDLEQELRNLEQELRKQFPRAVVRERQLSGEDGPTWYVYREGIMDSERDRLNLERDLRAVNGCTL